MLPEVLVDVIPEKSSENMVLAWCEGGFMSASFAFTCRCQSPPCDSPSTGADEHLFASHPTEHQGCALKLRGGSVSSGETSSTQNGRKGEGLEI